MTGQQFEKELVELGFRKTPQPLIPKPSTNKFVLFSNNLLGRTCRRCEVTTTENGVNVAYTSHGFSKYERAFSWRGMEQFGSAIKFFGNLFMVYGL